MQGIADRSLEELAEIKVKNRMAEQAPQAFPPIKSAWDIYHGEYPAPSFLVDGIIPDTGLFIIAGKKAAGKTQACLSIAAGVAAGGYALGRLKCEPAKVLYIQLELSERKIHERMHRMRLEAPVGLDFADTWPKGIHAVDAIKAAVAANGYELVIVDVMQKIWPPGRSNDGYAETYEMLGPLRELANRMGIAIICTTHTRKVSESDDILDSVLGSTAIVGNADVTVLIKKKRGTLDGALEAYGNDIPDVERAMRFDPDTTEWIITDGNPRETMLTPERREIMEYLREHGQSTSGKIAEALGRKQPSISNMLSKLMKESLVCSPGYGIYCLIDDPSEKSDESSESDESPADGTDDEVSSVSSVSSASQDIEHESIPIF